MYEDYWEFNRPPFRHGVDPDQFYLSPIHDEALARLHFLVEQRRRLGILLGSSGCGKSLLLSVFAGKQRRTGSRVALVNLLGMDGHEFLWSLANQFGLFPKTSDSLLRLWRMVADQFSENRYQQIDTLLLLDNVDDAEHDVLTQTLRIAHSSPAPDSSVSLVLAANIKRRELLGSSLLELSELRIDLEPWSATDTAAYIKHASSNSARTSEIFSSDALERIHQFSHGVPRRVNQLADLCLLAGAGNDLRQIDATTVEAVFHELRVRANK